MRPTVLMLIAAVLLAACGSRPEQVILPTQVIVDPETQDATPTPSAAEATAAPTLADLPTQPTPSAQRGVSPRTEANQFVVVSEPGSVIPPEGFTIGDLYVISNDGEMTQLTIDPAPDYDPVWSTDGNVIFFVSEREGAPYLYTLTASNTNPVQRLAPFDTGDQREPSPSRTTDQLLMTSNRNGNDDIFFIGIDGRGITQLTDDPASDREPSWSPDGQWIAFTSERDGSPNIFVTDVSGENLLQITTGGSIDHQPAFSPDGRRIAFISDRTDFTPQVFVVNLPEVVPPFGEGTVGGVAIDVRNEAIPPLDIDLDAQVPRPIQLTADDAPKASPEWFVDPEGNFRLTFTAVTQNPDGELHQIFAMNNDGSGVEPIGDPFVSFSNSSHRPQ